MNKRFAIILVFLVTVSSAFVQQGLKTQLKVTVIDEIGNIVEGASVKVYETKAQYESDSLLIPEQFSNKKGRVRFVGLKEQAYYIEVVKGEKDNSLGAVQTAKLIPGRINQINVIIE